MADARREELARLLLDCWDPLGVAERDLEPETEYLFEADKLLSLLIEGANESVVAAGLRLMATELGRVDLPRIRTTAQRILSWYLRPNLPPQSADGAWSSS